MAVGLRKSWLIAAAALLALAALLGWAWSDGGARPLGAMSTPAILPQVGR